MGKENDSEFGMGYLSGILSGLFIIGAYFYVQKKINEKKELTISDSEKYASMGVRG